MLREGKINGVIMSNESFMMKGLLLIESQNKVGICIGIKRALFYNQYVY